MGHFHHTNRRQLLLHAPVRHRQPRRSSLPGLLHHASRREPAGAADHGSTPHSPGTGAVLCGGRAPSPPPPPPPPPPRGPPPPPPSTPPTPPHPRGRRARPP